MQATLLIKTAQLFTKLIFAKGWGWGGIDYAGENMRDERKKKELHHTEQWWKEQVFVAKKYQKAAIYIIHKSSKTLQSESNYAHEI